MSRPWKGRGRILAVHSFVRTTWELLAPALFVSVLVAVFSSFSGALRLTVTHMLINLVVVVGLYVFIGNSGVLSFGHMSFMAIGAYTAALLTMDSTTKAIILPDLPSFLATIEFPTYLGYVLGGLVSGTVALIVGLPIMRLSGVAAAICTFGVLLVVQVVLGQWVSLTNGTSALVGIKTETNTIISLIWALTVMAAAYWLQRSRLGLRLRASREDELGARSIGIGILRERLIAFVISAFIVGVAGGLLGGFVGAIKPSDFYVGATTLTLAMLVLGGITSLSGAVVGVVVVSVLTEVLTRIEAGVEIGSLLLKAPVGLTKVGLSLALIVILIYRPKGITGGREVSWPFRRPQIQDRGNSDYEAESVPAVPTTSKRKPSWPTS